MRELEAPQHLLPSLRLLVFSLISFLKTNISEKFPDLGNSEKLHSKRDAGCVEWSAVTNHDAEPSIGTDQPFNRSLLMTSPEAKEA